MPKRNKIVNVMNYTSPQSFSCKICGYEAKGKRGMMLHSRYSHGNSLIPENTDFCSECCTSIKDVKDHMVHFHRK